MAGQLRYHISVQIIIDDTVSDAVILVPFIRFGVLVKEHLSALYAFNLKAAYKICIDFRIRFQALFHFDLACFEYTSGSRDCHPFEPEAHPCLQPLFDFHGCDGSLIDVMDLSVHHRPAFMFANFCGKYMKAVPFLPSDNTGDGAGAYIHGKHYIIRHQVLYRNRRFSIFARQPYHSAVASLWTFAAFSFRCSPFAGSSTAYASSAAFLARAGAMILFCHRDLTSRIRTSAGIPFLHRDALP